MRGRRSGHDNGGSLGAGLVAFFAVMFLGYWIGGGSDVAVIIAFVLAFPAMVATWVYDAVWHGTSSDANAPDADAPDAVQAAPSHDTAIRQTSRLRARRRQVPPVRVRPKAPLRSHPPVQQGRVGHRGEPSDTLPAL